LATVALGATLFGVAAAAVRPDAARIASCSTSDLAISVNGANGGTAGSYYFHIDFKNITRRTCRIAGFPGVSAVNARGRLVSFPAGREANGPATVVTLRPGRHTSALLRAIDTGVIPCASTRPAGLRVYPPNQKASKVAPFHYPVCTRKSSMTVRAIKTERGY